MSHRLNLHTMKYQVIVAGPEQTPRRAQFETALAVNIEHLGLAIGSDVEVTTVSSLDPRSVTCAIWCGSTGTVDPGELVVVAGMVDDGKPVFPLMDSLSAFRHVVPTALSHLNGREWGSLGAVVADVMRALRLLPEERQAFISYKRSESEAVARQLFAGLALRGFRPFLDTASVPAGVDVQDSLWCRMAGADLLVFIDTPHALDSRWVHDELARAHSLSLGVLQLVWPGHTRSKGTELCDLIELKPDDFVNKTASVDDELVPNRLNEIVLAAEGARIRSLALRQENVVSDILRQARGLGLRPEAQTMGPVRFFKNKKVVGTALPVVGLPDARIVHERESNLDPIDHKQARLVYNGLGASRSWLAHLDWLNERDGLRSLQVDRVEDWLKKL